ncbi:hypothetical protein ABZS66_25915 [Dactylosporangium sp. NPDC005572]|uniref:hypothetical protein n=1 Tax=Dactylosporangium sp. NPDC005572 TaxID=3156889 RepID=UPI0033A20F33
MLDAGGDPVERDAERPALRPVYRRPAPPRPRFAPPSVWVLSVVVTLLGLYGTLRGAAGIAGADDEEAALLLVFRTLLSAGQVACGAALLAGRRWGRTGSTALCAVNFALAVAGALTETLTPLQVWLGTAVNLVLFLALLGPRVYAWTDGR